MTELEAKKIVSVLLGAFPAARFTDDTVAIYKRMLADLDYPTANTAVEHLLASAKFLPSIAEIREAAISLRVGDRRQGAEGWRDFLDAVGAVGSHRPAPTFDDSVVGQCVDALGWRELCLSENQVADRARFIELYDRLSVTARSKQLSAGLPAQKRYAELVEQRSAKHAGAAIGDVMARYAALQLVPDEGGNE